MRNTEKLKPAVQRLNENKKAMPGANRTFGLPTIKMVDLMGREFPEAEWVVQGLIPEGITILSAPPASYKTWLLLDIVASVATGKPLFDEFATEQTGILVVDEENNERLLQQRLKLLGSEKDLPVYFSIEQGFKLDDEHVTKTIEFCEYHDIGLVTFDSLVRIHGGEENSATAMAEVFHAIRRFTKVGINVLITHHNRKEKEGAESSAQSMRGSSDILAAIDCHLALKRDKHNLTLTQDKLRIAEEHHPVELEAVTNNDSVSFEFVGLLQPPESKSEQQTAAILEMLDRPGSLNQKELVEKLKDAGHVANPKTVRNTLNDLVTQKTLTREPGKGNEIRYRINPDA